jgi:hypothetical protein
MEEQSKKHLPYGGIYRGNEPPDERLLLLRYLQNLWKILCAILVITLLGGGIYCLLHIVFAGEKMYRAECDMLVHYTEPYEDTGDYFVNYYTWIAYVSSDKFLNVLKEEAVKADPASVIPSLDNSVMAGYMSAEIKSDINVPTFYVTCNNEALAGEICSNVERVFSGVYGTELMGVDSMEVLTSTKVTDVSEVPRPGRAFALSAILGTLFVHLFYLLWETGTDSLYLPAQLSRRYGLCALGSMGQEELAANVTARFSKGEIHIVPATEDINPSEVAKGLREILPEGYDLVPVPAPLLDLDCSRLLQGEAQNLLVANAGPRAGKPLERTLEFLKVQNVTVKGTLLWEADEKLIRTYYRITPDLH